MGIDYTPVAGFTIPISDELKLKIRKLAEGIDANWEDKFETEFDVLGISYHWIGSSYTGDTENIPLFVPDNAIDLDKKLAAWLGGINTKLQTSFEIEDVIFVSDLHIS